MIKYIYKLTCCLLFVWLCTYNTGIAQFTPTVVEKSSQIIIHQGNRYYIHTVKKGHTLYSICKAYNTNEALLQKLNPNINLATLSVGQALKIPVKTQSTAHVVTQHAQQNEKYIQHIVQPKETLYSLSKQYQVSIDDIHKHNPNSRIGIRIGQILLIPNRHYVEVVDTSDTEFKPDLYEVKQGDTLYRISQTFGISINEMLITNPELRWGLKPGQKLIIPSDKTNLWLSQAPASDSVYTVYKQFDLPKYKCDSIANSNHKRPPVKVAVLLPFFVEQSLHPDTTSIIDSTGNVIKPKKHGLKGRLAAEFYEGILLAIDSLRQNNLDISLFVYDTEADTSRVKEILHELEIVEPDLILGPLAPPNVELVSRFSFEQHIPLIPPLVKGKPEANGNPFVYQTIPTEQNANLEYATYIARQLDTTGIVLVYMNNMKYRAEAETFKSALLQQVRLYYEPDSGFIREVFIDDALPVNLDSSLFDSTINKVLVLSSYEPDVVNVLSRLHFLLRDHQVEVFGFPAWQIFDNTRISVLHELQVTLYSPFYINYDDVAVKNFIGKCRNTLKTEPYKTSSKGTGINPTFMGYDLAMYFISATHIYGSNICKCTCNYRSPQLLSGYTFKRNMEVKHLMNHSISILHYTKDYKVVKKQ